MVILCRKCRKALHVVRIIICRYTKCFYLILQNYLSIALLHNLNNIMIVIIIGLMMVVIWLIVSNRISIQRSLRCRTIIY